MTNGGISSPFASFQIINQVLHQFQHLCMLLHIKPSGVAPTQTPIPFHPSNSQPKTLVKSPFSSLPPPPPPPERNQQKFSAYTNRYNPPPEPKTLYVYTHASKPSPSLLLPSFSFPPLIGFITISYRILSQGWIYIRPPLRPLGPIIFYPPMYEHVVSFPTHTYLPQFLPTSKQTQHQNTSLSMSGN